MFVLRGDPKTTIKINGNDQVDWKTFFYQNADFFFNFLFWPWLTTVWIRSHHWLPPEISSEHNLWSWLIIVLHWLKSPPKIKGFFQRCWNASTDKNQNKQNIYSENNNQIRLTMVAFKLWLENISFILNYLTNKRW